MTKPRNYQAEKTMAIQHQAEALAAIREERDAGILDAEVFQVAQALILCGLPYYPTDETRIVRKARLADGSEVVVVFAATSDAALPYGSDRSLLHFLLDRAMKNQSRFVSWETAKEFLDAMQMAPDSGKNYADLRKRFERIAGLSIYVRRVRTTGKTFVNMPVIRRAYLPTSVDRRRENAEQEGLTLTDTIPYGVEIGEDFYNEIHAHHVPIPVELIRRTRKQSQLQDLMLFLFWRCYGAQEGSLIAWKYLREQLWQGDSKVRRIKERFAQAIQTLKIIWPEVNAEARKEGLWVAPPINGRYLSSRGGESRRLPKAASEEPEVIRNIARKSLAAVEAMQAKSRKT